MKQALPACLWPAFLLGLVEPAAWANDVFHHIGATDPLLEGFRARLPPGSAVGPVTNDFGKDAWFISGAYTPTGYSYDLDVPTQQALVQRDWALSATLRLLQSKGEELALYVPTGRFLLGFGMQADGDPIVQSHSTSQPVWVYEGGGTGYHEYELQYDAASLAASLVVDGIMRLDDITVQTGWSTGFATWGRNSQASSRDLVYWHEVKLEFIPEPASGALFTLGALGLWLLRRLTCAQST